MIGKSFIALKRGEIVLVPLPFAEMTSTKARPALIISGRTFSSAEGRIIVAVITSNVAAHQNATSHAIPNWPAAGLKKSSVVTTWLATISPRLIQLKIGRLGDRDLREVGKRLRIAMHL